MISARYSGVPSAASTTRPNQPGSLAAGEFEQSTRSKDLTSDPGYGSWKDMPTIPAGAPPLSGRSVLLPSQFCWTPELS